jgi:mRNA interferase MazF
VVIGRGEIWWVTLPSPRRSEPGFKRPVVIVQADSFNRSKIKTVIAAVITSNQRLAEAPGNVSLRRSQSRLPKDSVINVSQLVTLDRSFLVRRVSRLAPRDMARLDGGLRLVLAV